MPKDIEFNNLCHDYELSKKKSERLEQENNKLKKDLSDLQITKQKNDDEFNNLVDDIYKLQDENEALKKGMSSEIKITTPEENTESNENKNKNNDDLNNLKMKMIN